MFVLPYSQHREIVTAYFAKIGFSEQEVNAIASHTESALKHGIRTHNALKYAHLVDRFGLPGGCVPGAEITKTIPSSGRQFKAVEHWNANKKCGIAVAELAFDRAMELADECGVGIVTVDNGFHYLWGGGHALRAAEKGYLAYTCCVSATSEVVPFCGTKATMGTNPHSWAVPTRDILGFDFLLDFATSTIAFGKVEQCKREGTALPEGVAYDAAGAFTTDPHKAVALAPFGGHKGHGLALLDEVFAALIGGGCPTVRGLFPTPADVISEPMKKRTTPFVFQAIRLDAFAPWADSTVRAAHASEALASLRPAGNEKVLYPGELEARAAAKSEAVNGLIMSTAELNELNELAQKAGVPSIDIASLAPAPTN